MNATILKTLVITCSTALTLAACGGKSDATEGNAPKGSGATSAAAQGSPNFPPGHPNVSDMGDMSGKPGVSPAARLTGEVLETMDAAGYTYIRLKGPEETWVAVSQTNVKVGDTVAIDVQMTLDDFESKSLDRKFKQIVFGTISNPGSPAPAATAPAVGMGAMHDSLKKIPDEGPIQVEKAPGGLTVAEIWANRRTLGGKQVVVRAKVVKFLPEIMGKNWLHIRDGSGSAEQGDNDLTVTVDPKQVTQKGDVVLITGTVRADVDLGQGYNYAVLIENAKISK